MTIVVGGAPETEPVAPESLDEEIAALRSQGLHARDIADQLSEKYGLPRREVYRRVVAVS